MLAVSTLSSDMTPGQPLYLSSLDSIRFEPVRECLIVSYLTFDSGKIGAVATIQPAVSGGDFSRSDDISSVVLAARFEGVSIDKIVEFPCFVFVAIPSRVESFSSPIRKDNLQIIGWGELYRSAEDARLHKFS
jgi:hypothetical protein